MFACVSTLMSFAYLNVGFLVVIVCRCANRNIAHINHAEDKLKRNKCWKIKIMSAVTTTANATATSSAFNKRKIERKMAAVVSRKH